MVRSLEFKGIPTVENQTIDRPQSKNRSSFGFSREDYDSFKTSYSQISFATAHNDYCYVSLLSEARTQISEKNFSDLLRNGLRLSVSEISDINRKLAAFREIPSQIIWDTIGYRGIQKMMSMPRDSRETLMEAINSCGDNFTLKDFNSLYNRVTNRNTDKDTSKNSKMLTISRSDLEKVVRQSIEKVIGKKPKGKKWSNRFGGNRFEPISL